MYIHWQLYNLRHAVRRVWVEQAIGAFKRRFRLFRLGFQGDMDSLKYTAMAAACIHNFITSHEGRRLQLPDLRDTQGGFYRADELLQGMFTSNVKNPDLMRKRITDRMFAKYQREVIAAGAADPVAADNLDHYVAAGLIDDRQVQDLEMPDNRIFGKWNKHRPLATIEEERQALQHAEDKWDLNGIFQDEGVQIHENVHRYCYSCSC